MIEIPGYEGHGRTIMVEFMCWRCKTRAYRPLKDCVPLDHGIRFMSDLRAPDKWEDGGFYYPMLCPECAKKYQDFMNCIEIGF